MKIAPSYFERLLERTDPMEAVQSLNSFWLPRAEQDRPRFGLSEPEYNVQLCLLYVGTVGGQGHEGFFAESAAFLVEDILAALSAVGLSEFREILQAGLGVFPEQTLPRDWDLAERAVDALPGEALATLSALDRRLSDVSMSVYPAALEHLRTHRDEILVPERSPGNPWDGFVGGKR